MNFGQNSGIFFSSSTDEYKNSIYTKEYVHSPKTIDFAASL